MEKERIKEALLGSLKLSMSGHHEEALRLVDDAIVEAIKDGEDSWVFIFVDHAAILNQRGFRDHSLSKRYYEEYLTHRSENPRVLYRLADLAMKDGQTEIAKQYAERCHQAILRGDDAKIKRELLDLVLERWPDRS